MIISSSYYPYAIFFYFVISLQNSGRIGKSGYCRTMYKNGLPITWQCIKNLYHQLCTDVENPCGLTKDHVYLPGFLKMRVHLATQIFSRKVVAGLKSRNLANKEELNYLEIGIRIRNLLLLRTSKCTKDNYEETMAELRSIIKYFTEWINDTSIVDTMDVVTRGDMRKTVINELTLKMSKNKKKKIPTVEDIEKAVKKKNMS